MKMRPEGFSVPLEATHERVLECTGGGATGTQLHNKVEDTFCQVSPDKDQFSECVIARWLIVLLSLLFPPPHSTPCTTVAFRIYDMDKDGYISNGELFPGCSRWW